MIREYLLKKLISSLLRSKRVDSTHAVKRSFIDILTVTFNNIFDEYQEDNTSTIVDYITNACEYAINTNTTTEFYLNWSTTKSNPNRKKELEQMIVELKRYFTSGNDVPVERATIYAKDFWKIINESPSTSSKYP